MPLFSGPPDVTKLAAKGDLGGLIKALGFPQDRRVRNLAAKALKAFGVSAVGQGGQGSQRRPGLPLHLGGSVGSPSR